jgi:hypothetical protein
MEHGEIQNPPSSPTPPDLPYEAPRKRPVEKEKESEGGLPGLPAPA